MSDETAPKRHKIEPHAGQATQFTTTNQPANPGRKPFAVTFLKSLTGKKDLAPDLTKDEVFQTLRFLFEQCNVVQLEQINASTDAPAYLVNVASAILKDIKDGKVWTYQAFLEQFFEKLPDGEGAGRVLNLFVGQFPGGLPNAITSEEEALTWGENFNPKEYLELKANGGTWKLPEQ